MTLALMAGLAGLAFLDSFNPATLGAVALILLAAPHRPGWTALASVLGAAITVFGVGAILFISAGAAAAIGDGILVAFRFIAFGAAAVALTLAGFRRLRARPRRPIALPTWFGFATALPFGVILTAADLPNAFPYFIAIERLVDAGVDTGTALIALAAYTFIYRFMSNKSAEYREGRLDKETLKSFFSITGPENNVCAILNHPFDPSY